VSSLRLPVFFLLAVVCTLPCWATYPDAAFGVYTYTSSDLNVTLDWQLEQINVVVNGQKFTNVKSDADENGDNFGSEGTWPFLIVISKDELSESYIHLTLLMEKGFLKKVGALYYRREVTDVKTRQGHVTTSRVFDMKFKPAT
jgi:hypothetical protein